VSGFKVSKVNQVQIQVDQETAALIAGLLLRVNWDQFPQAEGLRAALYDEGGLEEDIDLTWDEAGDEFVKA